MTNAETKTQRIDRLLWHTDLRTRPRLEAAAVYVTRLVYALLRDLTQGQLNLQAMSLVYTTLLSLVPLLAVSFSVLKGFGVHNQIEPMLLQALSPLGDKGVEATERIIGFVDNMQVRVLGSVGLIALIVTVVMLIQRIESVFNQTWRVTKPRPFAQRFGQYLTVLMFGPVLFFAAVGVTASVSRMEVVQTMMHLPLLDFLLDQLSHLIPYLMITLVFAFVYVFVPSTRVRLWSAIIGALVAGVLWQTIGWLFANFMVSSTRYTAVYSSLAILILFMIWIYIAWLILLIGASIAFYHQHSEYLASRTGELHLGNQMRERLALTLVGTIAAAHRNAEIPPPTDEDLARELGVPLVNVELVLTMLTESDFVAPTTGDPPRYVPVHASDQITVKAVLDAARHYGDKGLHCRGIDPLPGVADVERRVDQAIEQALAGKTLADLGAQLDQQAGP